MPFQTSKANSSVCLLYWPYVFGHLKIIKLLALQKTIAVFEISKKINWPRFALFYSEPAQVNLNWPHKNVLIINIRNKTKFLCIKLKRTLL